VVSARTSSDAGVCPVCRDASAVVSAGKKKNFVQKQKKQWPI